MLSIEAACCNHFFVADSADTMETHEAMRSSRSSSNIFDVGINMSDDRKQIPLAFENLSVSAPDLGFVKVHTLARAVINTFGYDQAQWIARYVLTPLGLVRPPKQKTIIDSIYGLVKPGEMLLLLGRPGSGCSTLLRAAANRSTLNVTGDLRYAGIAHTEFYHKHRRETIYLPEEDKHISSLTVRQTLEFAIRMAAPKSQRSGKMVGDGATKLASMFGLEHALDSAVSVISGGERKR